MPDENLSMSTQSVPRWWKLWEPLARHYMTAAEGRYRHDRSLCDQLEQAGFDASRLRMWTPSQHDGRRIAVAYHTALNARSSPPINSGHNKEKVIRHLRGRGVWKDWRRLANAYLDGRHEAAAGAVRPRPAAAVPRAPVTNLRQRRARVIRQLDGQQPLRPRLDDIAQLLRDARDVTVYLDETWAEISENRRNEGVIAALVCRGEPRFF